MVKKTLKLRKLGNGWIIGYIPKDWITTNNLEDGSTLILEYNKNLIISTP